MLVCPERVMHNVMSLKSESAPLCRGRDIIIILLILLVVHDMHDNRVLSSGDMCMTLSGHTSTLPRLVVQGHDFEGHSLGCRFGPTSSIMVGLLTRVIIYY